MPRGWRECLETVITQKFYTFLSSKAKGCLARLPARQPICLAAYWAAGWFAIASSINF